MEERCRMMRALNGGKRVQADAFQCTLMIGNPGVGKSTLLNAVVVQLRTTGPTKPGRA